MKEGTNPATSARSTAVRHVDEHPSAAITGGLVHLAGRVFVPVQRLNEEVQGGRQARTTAVFAPTPPTMGLCCGSSTPNRELTTANGFKATGGSMDGPGPTVAGGLLIVNSGYGGISGRPRNVLFVFGVE